MTTVVITQPMYLPWVGLISQLALADRLIWLDDAQFTRSSFIHRVQVKSAGKPAWLTVPLVHQGQRQRIDQLSFAASGWAEEHCTTFARSVAGGAFQTEAMAMIRRLGDMEDACSLFIESTTLLAEAINPGRLAPVIRRSSRMEVSGGNWRRILDLVHAVGGTRYLTGHGAANYLDHLAFEAEGVSVEYMGYDIPPWPQAHGAFTPYVTGLDLIANVAPGERANHLGLRTIPWREFLAAKGIPFSG